VGSSGDFHSAFLLAMKKGKEGANKVPVIHDTDMRQTLILLEWLDRSIWLSIKPSLLNEDNFRVVFSVSDFKKNM